MAFELEKIFTDSFEYCNMKAHGIYGVFSFFYNLHIGNLTLDENLEIKELEN